MKKHSQSVFDHFFNIYPNVTDNVVKKTDLVDSKAANTLFSIWRTSESSHSDKVITRPGTVSLSDVEGMVDAGLVKSIGDKLEITSKGEKVIKVMVLGDDRSSFDDDNIMIDYNEALSNTQTVKTAKKTKVADSWWGRFESNNS